MPITPELVELVRAVGGQYGLASPLFGALAVAYGARRLSKAVEHMGNGTESGLKSVADSLEKGLKSFMSSPGSGADHLEAGMNEIARNLGAKPMVVKADVTVKRE